MSSVKHVAIIMDGNGRWAKERNRPRLWGHVRGAQRVAEIVEQSARLGLESLTLYAFSTENWSRPIDEVTGLFRLLKKFLVREMDSLIKNNIRFSVVGNYRVLDSQIVALVDEVMEKTEQNDGLELSLAINYGGRSEIVDAVNSFLSSTSVKEVTEADISNHLYNPRVENIDLLIRTAGDQRISNFLLWQLSYAEFYFTETKWPDFNALEFHEIIEYVSGRERRFGSLKQGLTLKETQTLSRQNLKLLS